MRHALSTLVVLVLSTVLFVGCGGDSGSSVASSAGSSGPPSPPSSGPPGPPMGAGMGSSGGGSGSSSGAPSQPMGAGMGSGGGSSMGSGGSGSAMDAGAPPDSGPRMPMGTGMGSGGGSSMGSGGSGSAMDAGAPPDSGPRMPMGAGMGSGGGSAMGMGAPMGSGGSGSAMGAGAPMGAGMGSGGSSAGASVPPAMAPGGMSPGGNRPRGAAGGNQQQNKPASSGLGGFLGAMFGGGKPGAEQNPDQQGLYELAVDAMRLGQERRAFGYLYASMLADDDSKLYEKFQWVPALKRPSLGVRWALAVQTQIKQPRIFRDNYYPVGVDQQLPQRQSRSRRGRGGGEYGGGSGPPGEGGMGMPGMSGPEMGGSGMDEPDMGMPGMSGPGMSGPGMMGSSGGRRGGVTSVNLASATTPALMKQTTGMLADEFMKKLKKRVTDGDFGAIFPELIEAARKPRQVARPGQQGLAGGPGAMPGGSGMGRPGMMSGSGPGSMPGSMPQGSMPGSMPQGSMPGSMPQGSGSGSPMGSGMGSGMGSSPSGYDGADEPEEGMDEMPDDMLNPGGYNGADEPEEGMDEMPDDMLNPGAGYDEGSNDEMNAGMPGGMNPGGMGPGGMMPGGMGPGGMMPGGGRNPGVGMPAGPVNPRCVMAAVTFLGKGDAEDLKEKALEENADVLALFDVKIDVNVRNNVVTNESRIILWDVRKGVEICRTKLINAVRVQQHKSDPRYQDEDPVGDAVDLLFDNIDGKSESTKVMQLKVAEFPKVIRPEHAAGRVGQLVTSQTEDPLPVLAEIKFYHQRGLIDDDLLTQAMVKVLSDGDGKTLAEGDSNERRDIVEKLVPEAITASDEEEDE